MKFIRLFIIIVLTGAAIYTLANIYQHKRIFSRAAPAVDSPKKPIKKSSTLQQKAKEAKAFAAQNDFNTQVCL
jgi:hypothetical protein